MLTNAGKKLKIVLYSMRGAGMHYGGPGMSAYNLYRSDTKSRFDVTLVHGYGNQPNDDVFSNHILISNAQENTKLQALKLNILSKRWIRQHIQQFDVYHGLTAFETPVRCGQLAEALGVPAVVKVAGHATDLSAPRGWFPAFNRSIRRRSVVAALSGVIAISNAIEHELLAYGVPESKIAKIPNGVNCERFSPVSSTQEQQRLRGELGIADRPTIAFCGGVNRRKQPHLVVEALGYLAKSNIDCQLVVAGPFNDAAYLEQMQATAASLGVSERIVYLGFVSETERVLKAADLFCLPSLSEGMPNALLEAMACGLPCIASPISGVTDIIEDGVNSKFASYEPSEIADIISSYLANEPLRAAHASQARKSIVERFSAEAVLSLHEQLFRRIVAGRAAAG